MESFATPYPLIFTDGEQEFDKGHIGIHSVLSFKRFQAQLSRLIGLPASQLSAVFVCRRTTSRDADKRQKLPINENTNFNIILNQHNPSRERDCHFLISLKKSKKERKVARKKATEAESVDDDDSNSSRGDVSPAGQRPSGAEDAGFSSPTSVLEQLPEESADRPPSPVVTSKIRIEEEAPRPKPQQQLENDGEQQDDAKRSMMQLSSSRALLGGRPVVISRNSAGMQAKFGAIGSPRMDQNQQQPAQQQQAYHQFGEGGGQARFKDAIQPQQRLMQMQRASASAEGGARLLANFQQGRFANLQPRFSGGSSSSSLGGEVKQQVERFCPDCLSYKERNIRPPPFHCCINDRITAGFRGPSPAGPIERPVKRQVKAAA